ncbi:MAG: glycosyltransferase [Chloroflexota bacterium]
MTDRNILIYANKVTKPSETFIYFPAFAMQRYTPYYVGSLYGEGFDIPENRKFIANGGWRFGRIKQRVNRLLFGHNGVGHLTEKIRPINPLLIQAHFGTHAHNVLPLVHKLDIPFIVYYHGFDATMSRAYAESKPHLRNYLQQLPRLHAESTLVLTQSNYLRERVIQDWGYPAEKVRTHYIGIEPSDEAPLPLSQREPMVLFVARLVEKKGARYLLDAMKTVQERYPDVELVMVGSGVLREQLEAQADALKLNVRFLGWQVAHQVADLMKRARIFCVPSVNAKSGDAEGFGMVFLEAQRAGTPVISTQHGGIVESVADGVVGTLVPEKQPAPLADAILDLLDDSAKWERYSQAGYERVQNEFSMQTLVAKLETIYDTVI